MKKTHYPYMKFMKPFESSRNIIVVRNPFDACVSYFHMKTTLTHYKSTDERLFTENYEDWDEFTKWFCARFREFYGYWLNSGTPCMFIRFEDIIEDK